MSFFVGIAFDDPTRAAFARAIELARPHAEAKWEKPDKAHLTLVFLAETRPEPELISQVALKHAPFSLKLEKAGAFGSRVLWLGLESAPLRALQAELIAALKVDDPHGEYTPHVTIARAKRRLSFDRALDALKSYQSDPFQVGGITLFESRAGEYTQLTQHPLAG